MRLSGKSSRWIKWVRVYLEWLVLDDLERLAEAEGCPEVEILHALCAKFVV